ncbi:MAG: PHP domain-containing protein [Spirochaetes bacterium]|nr:PHP domain-containing protein [Spirochaetota bacterium]
MKIENNINELIDSQWLIDLHTHTTASDGIFSPKDLIDYAVEIGCRVLAIADHDTVAGLESAIQYAAGKDIVLVPSVEFSIDYENGSFHLLGMNINHRDDMLLEAINDLQEKRSTRITRIVNDLKKHGIYIREEEIIAEAGGESIGRPHVARVLVRHGYARNIEDVFKKYLVPGKPGYVKKEKITLEQAIALIRHAGGKAIVAHPVSLNVSGYRQLDYELLRFREKGIDGIEVYATMHENDFIQHLLDFAGKYGLAISGGSDFHGDKHEQLGFYGPPRKIPSAIWDPLSHILKL